MSSRLDKAQDSLDIFLATLEKSAKAVSKEIAKGIKAGNYDDKLASHNCYLAQATAKVIHEIRQLEKHERNAAANLSDDEFIAEVLARVAELPVEKRAAFAKQVAAIESKKVV